MENANLRSFVYHNQHLISCYGDTHPMRFRQLAPTEQRDLCIKHRAKVEDFFLREKIQAKDFFAIRNLQ